MNSDVKKYINDIKALFPVFQKEEKLFFKKLHETILKESMSEIFSYQDCIDKFGTPKEIISTYYEEIDTHLLIKRIKNQHTIRNLFYILGTAIIITSLIACSLLYKSYNNVKSNNVTEIETVIE